MTLLVYILHIIITMQGVLYCICFITLFGFASYTLLPMYICMILMLFPLTYLEELSLLRVSIYTILDHQVQDLTKCRMFCVGILMGIYLIIYITSNNVFTFETTNENKYMHVYIPNKFLESSTEDTIIPVLM